MILGTNASNINKPIFLLRFDYNCKDELILLLKDKKNFKFLTGSIFKVPDKTSSPERKHELIFLGASQSIFLTLVHN